MAKKEDNISMEKVENTEYSAAEDNVVTEAAEIDVENTERGTVDGDAVAELSEIESEDSGPIERVEVPENEAGDEAVEKRIAEGNPTVKRRGAVLAAKDRARMEREEAEQKMQRALLRESALRNAADRRTVMYGKVVGVEDLEYNQHHLICAIALLDKEIKVHIPFDQFYVESPMDMSTVDMTTEHGRMRYYNRQKQMLEKTYGLETPIIIERIVRGTRDKTDILVLASRAKALLVKRKVAFTGATPQLAAGEYYDLNVVSVAVNSLGVELGGVDTVINKYELTNEPISDLRDRFKTGDTIRALLKDINIGSNNRVSIKLDPIAYELEEAMSRRQLLKIGNYARGIVTRVYRNPNNNQITIYAWIPDYNVPTKVKSMSSNDLGREIVAGDEVRLTILGFLPSGYVLSGCRGINGAGGLLFRR